MRDSAIQQQFIDLRPSGGFDLIMADPPWRFDNFSARGEAKNPSAHYGCMDLSWIKALPVEILAAPDCLLWLWATNPLLPEAIEVLTAWGFTFKTAGTWCKRTAHGRDGFGTGYVLRSANEPFLIGTRGAPKVTRGTRSTLASYGPEAPRAGEGWPIGSVTIEGPLRAHSQKPEESFAACEELMPAARRIEVFSRTDRPGWSAWGNETGTIGGQAVA